MKSPEDKPSSKEPGEGMPKGMPKGMSEKEGDPLFLSRRSSLQRLCLFLRSLIFDGLFYGLTFFCAVFLLPFLLLPRQVSRFIATVWCKASLFLLRICVGLDYRLKGVESLPPPPYILASQHQSAWDTLFFPALFAKHLSIVLKQELMWIPLFGWYLKKTGVIPINRKGSTATLRLMLERAKRAALRQDIILIFPEGHRGAPGHPLPIQPGIAALYRSLHIPVVPVSLTSGKFWGRRAFVKYPGEITVEFLDPIAPGLSKEMFLQNLKEKGFQEPELRDH